MLRSAWTAAIGVSVVVPVASSSSFKKENCSVRGSVPAVKSDGRRWRSLQPASTSKKQMKAERRFCRAQLRGGCSRRSGFPNSASAGCRAALGLSVRVRWRRR